MALYTLSMWLVKPGREEEFAAAWRELADWTARQLLGGAGARQARLLRDRDQPNRFISFGPWDRMEVISAWRAHPGFGERVANMQGMLEDFSPMTLDDVTTSQPKL